MKAGNLPHKVTIEQRTATQDQDTGHITYTWSKYGDFYAHVYPKLAKDQVQSQASQSVITATCTLRSSNKSRAIISDMRLLHRGKYYQIDGNSLADNQSGLEWVTLNLTDQNVNWGE